MFHVGQQVVCVDDRGTSDMPHGPKRGITYEVRDCDERFVFLREIPSTRTDLMGWYASRFRPLHSIQIFHDIANGVKQPEKENA